jgi:hypothetical protein
MAGTFTIELSILQQPKSCAVASQCCRVNNLDISPPYPRPSLRRPSPPTCDTSAPLRRPPPPPAPVILPAIFTMPSPSPSLHRKIAPQIEPPRPPSTNKRHPCPFSVPTRGGPGVSCTSCALLLLHNRFRKSGSAMRVVSSGHAGTRTPASSRHRARRLCRLSMPPLGVDPPTHGGSEDLGGRGLVHPRADIPRIERHVVVPRKDDAAVRFLPPRRSLRNLAPTWPCTCCPWRGTWGVEGLRSRVEGLGCRVQNAVGCRISTVGCGVLGLWFKVGFLCAES